MNLLAWNCRGLGNHRTEKELGEIIQAQVPTIVFLSETWSSKSQMERIKNLMVYSLSLVMGGVVDWLLCGKEEIWCGWIASQNITLMP